MQILELKTSPDMKTVFFKKFNRRVSAVKRIINAKEGKVN